MRIAVVNEGDWGGNAQKVVFLLHRHLRRQGADAHLLVRIKRRHDSVAELLPFSRSLSKRLRRSGRRFLLQCSGRSAPRRSGASDESFDPGWTQYGAELADVLSGYDLVNLQFVSKLVDYEAFLPQVSSRSSVVWTLHDMNAFTGGCHYAACGTDRLCKRFAGGCGCCPELHVNGVHDLSHRAWQMKRRAFDGVASGRLCLVTPSSWLGRVCRDSPLLGGLRTSVIPYAVDLEAFQPRPRDLARSVLGLPPDGKAVLFVAQSRDNRRKGFGLLTQALKSVGRRRKVYLISVGQAVSCPDLPFDLYDLGRIASDGMLSLAYSACDVFVAPSILDNLPCTTMEAVACGTPVVAFDAGGISDVVRDRETGRLAPTGDTTALARAIEEILDGEGVDEMRRNCRELAATEFAPDVVARRYLDVYAAAAASR